MLKKQNNQELEVPSAHVLSQVNVPTKFKIKISKTIYNLPDIKDRKKIDVKYPLIEPYSYVHIYWDERSYELIYELKEPKLNEDEKKVLEMLETGIEELINISFIAIKSSDVVIAYLEKNMRILLNEFRIKITEQSFLKIMYYIWRDFVGLNEIESLMRDFYIEDIECNGVKTPIYIVHRKYKNIRTNIQFNDIKRLTSFIEKLAQKCGKYISYASPLLDGSLPEGSRVNATYTQDISSKGPSFCFADGYLQLNDGRIKDIKEFFEECKNNFGFKIENGNEIVEINNLGCCGVDENNLTQHNSKLKTIIKLKPPRKLVNIKFEDGSEITTTTNHLFHVADDSLKLIKAEKLKEGMFVPMPMKVNVQGYRQTADVYNLLKEFSYNNKVCLISNLEIINIVNSEISSFKAKYPNFRNYMSNQYNVHNSYFYEIISKGKSISFEVLDSICKDIDELNDINIVVYGGGRKGKSKAIKIPKEIDEDLAYLAGAIISDGHLSRGSIDISCFEEGFKEAVTSKLLKKFGKFESYYNGTRIYLSNLFVPFFFNKVFKIPYGKKAYTVEIPETISKSDNKVIASFIKGLFDGDGTCSSGLSYKTASNKLAYQLTYLLSRLGIYSYVRFKEKMYQIVIPSIYESLYAKTIGFNNINKISHLNRLILKKSDIKSYIRHGRIPASPVLNLIKSLKIPRYKICKECKVSFNRLVNYDSLSKPFVNKIISFLEKEFEYKVFNNYNFIYLKWLVNCNQEFTKIISVNIYNNTKNIPVFDIELEPCKFFIAGNKPMNIFDTIRKFTENPWTPTKLMQFRTVSPEVLAYLWILIEYEANIMVIGGTGSGKTTFLNSIAFFIPPQARIVSIEDTHELNLWHENWLPSITREGVGVTNLAGEKHGEITLFDLLKESFRQRPDYVIVGEIRGKEAFVLFQGMSSIRGDEEIFVLNHDHPKRIKIKDLKQDVKYKAISMDERGKIVILPVKAKYTHSKRNKLYRIVTKKGREITLTPNHSIFSYNKKIEAKYVDSLKEGDNIIIPAKIPCGYANIDHFNLLEIQGLRIYSPSYVKKAVKKLGYYEASRICGVKSISDFYSNFKRSKCSSLKTDKFILLMKKARIKYNLNKIKVKSDNNSFLLNAKLKITDDLLKLLGYYISEGSLQNNKKNSKLALYAKNPKIIKDMENCIKSVVKNVNIRKRITRGFGESTELSFSHKPLINFIEQCCNSGSLNKRIPSFIFGLSKHKIGQFLSALYSGDGCFTNNYFGYYTISKNLASDLSHLLNVYGIVPAIRKRKRRKNMDYEILFYLYDEKKKFLEYVKPIREKIPLIKGKKRNLLNDVYIDKIKKIEEIHLKNPAPV